MTTSYVRYPSVNSPGTITPSSITLTDGHVLVGNSSAQAADVAMSGDITITDTGVTAIGAGKIVNAQVNAAAAIAGTKISPDFGSQNITTTGSFTSGGIVGVTDGSSAAAGKVGQELKAYSGGGGSPAYVTASVSAQFFDVASLTITAGDWLVTIRGETNKNGGTPTEVTIGLGTATGNDATGLVSGDTAVDVALPISTDNSGFCLANIHISLSGSATYYLKGYAAFTVAGTNIRGTMNAIRIR